MSSSVCSSVGSPQGCVLSPILFILYPNMCQSSFYNRFIVKYADDTVIVSLLQKDEDSHGPIVGHFAQWCNDSNLLVNVAKTKDMIIDFRKNPRAATETSFNGKRVDFVDKYKYLGTIIDSSLNFEANWEAVVKKGNQRLFCLRKLSQFQLNSAMFTFFY